MPPPKRRNVTARKCRRRPELDTGTRVHIAAQAFLSLGANPATTSWLFRAFGEAGLAHAFILSRQRLSHGRALVSYAGSSSTESPRPPVSGAAARARPQRVHSPGA